tara:strand:- start:1078 stop:2238 length:1161 start_codon:yes stop_codon:yes gene_type:complete
MFDKKMFTTYQPLFWCKFGSKSGILFKGHFFEDGNVLLAKRVEHQEHQEVIILEEINFFINMDFIGVFRMPVGGLGDHTRLQVQTSDSKNACEIIALNLTKERLETLKKFVEENENTSFVKGKHVYNINDKPALNFLLSDAREVTKTIVKLASLDISCYSPSAEKNISLLAERTTRSYDHFGNKGDRAGSVPPKPAHWNGVELHGKNHYNIESISRAIALHDASLFSSPNPFLCRALQTAGREQVKYAEYVKGELPGPLPKFDDVKGNHMPKLCQEYQILICRAFLHRIFLDKENDPMVNAFFLFFACFGYFGRLLSKYVRSNDFRGFYSEVRTFSSESKGKEALTVKSVCRFVVSERGTLVPRLSLTSKRDSAAEKSNLKRKRGE